MSPEGPQRSGGAAARRNFAGGLTRRIPWRSRRTSASPRPTAAARPRRARGVVARQPPRAVEHRHRAVRVLVDAHPPLHVVPPVAHRQLQRHPLYATRLSRVVPRHRAFLLQAHRCRPAPRPAAARRRFPAPPPAIRSAGSCAAAGTTPADTRWPPPSPRSPPAPVPAAGAPAPSRRSAPTGRAPLAEYDAIISIPNSPIARPTCVGAALSTLPARLRRMPVVRAPVRVFTCGQPSALQRLPNPAQGRPRALLVDEEPRVHLRRRVVHRHDQIPARAAHPLVRRSVRCIGSPGIGARSRRWRGFPRRFPFATRPASCSRFFTHVYDRSPA